MTYQQRLVNNQFNSPINLYSQQNIQEVLEKEKQILANGGVGINFYNPAVGKPNNLQNSAVLRMLEEEERSGLTRGAKRVAWPPSENDKVEGDQNPSEGGPRSATSPSGLSNNPQRLPKAAPYPGRVPLKPLTISCNLSSPALSPHSPILNQSPAPFASTNKTWAPVHSPSRVPQTPPVQSYPQSYPPPKTHTPTQVLTDAIKRSSSPIRFGNPNFAQSSQPITASGQVAHHQQQILSANKRLTTPPPSTITLRPQAPVSQAPPPVFASQPATATLRGGKNLRGDLKWPPEPVKKQAEEENRQRLELAKGPACRPRKVNKDYSNFFAQHALNSSYPGYKAPPGTQYYGVSDF